MRTNRQHCEPRGGFSSGPERSAGASPREISGKTRPFRRSVRPITGLPSLNLERWVCAGIGRVQGKPERFFDGSANVIRQAQVPHPFRALLDQEDHTRDQSIHDHAKDVPNGLVPAFDPGSRRRHRIVSAPLASSRAPNEPDPSAASDGSRSLRSNNTIRMGTERSNVNIRITIQKRMSARSVTALSRVLPYAVAMLSVSDREGPAPESSGVHGR